MERASVRILSNWSWSMFALHMCRFLTISWWAYQIRLRTHFTVKGHNWVSLTYYDFNSYLVITRLIHKEMLGVCDNEIHVFLYKHKAYKHMNPQNCPKLKHILSIYWASFFIKKRGRDMLFSKIIQEMSNS